MALSNTAIINAKPNLMISNPNTIASHGNSIGNIDASTLFYLRQKGLNKDQAIALIITSLKNQFFDMHGTTKKLDFAENNYIFNFHFIDK